MSKTAHSIYIFIMASIVVATTIFLGYKGYSYYSTPMEERFYHPDHLNFKPSGLYGQGLGILGTLLIFLGVVIYIIRKRYKFCARWGRLKYWLEFHIFLCSLGPVMILFHTAFKFGGIVSIAFWSMVAVVVSGIIGRYIYIQIPRSIEGSELSLQEIKATQRNISAILQESYQLDIAPHAAMAGTLQLQSSSGTNFSGNRIFFKAWENQRRLSQIKRSLREKKMSRKEIKRISNLIKEEITINKRIERLQLMQQLFKYWHVAHMPFALVMVVIVVIHVVVTLALGYTWIF